MDSDSKADVYSTVLNDKADTNQSKTQIKQSRIGLWDFYEEIEVNPVRFALGPLSQKLHELAECLPYLARMFRDVLSVPGCAPLMLVYVATQLGEAIVPAVSIWFQGQFLSITQAAIETRAVDKQRLVFITTGQLACTVALFFIGRLKRKISNPLNARIRRWWALHCFHAHARLDHLTFAKSDVQRQLYDITDTYWGESVIFCSLELVAEIVSIFMRLFITETAHFMGRVPDASLGFYTVSS